LVGQLDEVLLDKRALSAVEIDQLYRGQLQPGEPANVAPTVNAGSDSATIVGTSHTLSGSAVDDGRPNSGLTFQWVVVSGPGSVAFGNANSALSTATFATSGTYLLRLWASDGQLQASDDVLVTVSPSNSISNVVGFWQFEDSGSTVLDSSGNQNHGTLQDGARVGIGHTGSGLLVSESGHSAIIPHAQSLMPAQQITVAAWIAPITKGTQVVVSKAKIDAVDGYELTLSNAGKVFIRFNQDSAGDSFRVDSATSYSTNGSWLHVAATYDGAIIRLYVNGQLESSKAASLNINPNVLAVGIGAEASGARGMKGRIDDVLIAGRALNAGEIAALFGGASPFAVPAANSLAIDAQPNNAGVFQDLFIAAAAPLAHAEFQSAPLVARAAQEQQSNTVPWQTMVDQAIGKWAEAEPFAAEDHTPEELLKDLLG
jgi:hypothetical protein